MEKDHNIWDYVYFIYSVKVKDFTDYNGFETYVKEKMDQEDINWFPFLKTRVLSIKKDQEELKNIFKEINEKFDQIENTKMIRSEIN